MKKIYTLILIIFLLNKANAEQVDTIAAIVDDQIISTTDLYERTNLTMTLMNIEKNQSNADALLPKILQQLIDEKLIIKESHRLKLNVSTNEIDENIKDLEVQNNMNRGDFIKLLSENHVSQTAINSHISSQLLWGKIIGFAIRPKLTVSENEIQEVLNLATPDQAQVSFKQILIPIEQFKDDNEIKSQILKLTELRSNITSCEDLDFLSRKIDSKSEIDSLTLPVNQIHKDLQNMIKTLPIGKASKVIRSKTSLRVISVCSRSFLGLDSKSKAEVGNLIMQKKMITQATHYLSNLRKKTFIEVNI